MMVVESQVSVPIAFIVSCCDDEEGAKHYPFWGVFFSEKGTSRCDRMRSNDG